jgi:5,10-methylenetetrahydromethanopterin reductase
MTAAAIATIDEAAEGRAVLGIGAGVSGFKEMHLERRHAAAAVGEAVDLVRTLLSGARATRHGQVVRFDGSLAFTPFRPRIPLFVAAGGPRMLRMASACADGVILQAQATAAEMDVSRRRIHEAARLAGRKPEDVLLVARLDIAIQPARERALQVLRSRAARILTRAAPTFRRFHDLGLEITDDIIRLAGQIAYTHDPKAYEALGGLLAPELIDAVCVAATPETLGGQLAAVFSWGVDHIIVHPILPSDSLPDALHAFIEVLATVVA